jgi:hypothetical protein
VCHAKKKNGMYSSTALLGSSIANLLSYKFLKSTTCEQFPKTLYFAKRTF